MPWHPDFLPSEGPVLASLLPRSSVFQGLQQFSGDPPGWSLTSAVVPARSHGASSQDQHPRGPGLRGLRAGRGHWGWASGGPLGSGACGPDPGSASSASSSDATPSSSRKTWRTVRVVKVRGPRLQGGGETERQQLNEGGREKSEKGTVERENKIGGRERRQGEMERGGQRNNGETEREPEGQGWRGTGDRGPERGGGTGRGGVRARKPGAAIPEPVPQCGHLPVHGFGRLCDVLQLTLQPPATRLSPGRLVFRLLQLSLQLLHTQVPLLQLGGSGAVGHVLECCPHPSLPLDLPTFFPPATLLIFLL